MLFDKLKIIITSKSQAFHLQLKEILANLNLSKLNIPQGTTPNIAIDSLFEIRVAEQFIHKNMFENTNYQLLVVEMDKFDLSDMQAIKTIQKIDPELFIIIASASGRHWYEIIKFLGLSSHILFLKTPFDTGETLLAIQNIMHEQRLKQYFHHHLFQQLHACEGEGKSSRIKLDNKPAIFDDIHFEKKLNQTLSVGYVEYFNTSVACLKIEEVTSLGGETVGYITENLLDVVKERLQCHAVEGWTLGDWGQGCFGIMIPRVTDPKTCEKHLSILHDKLTEPYEIYGTKLMISISIGVAFSEAVTTSATQLISYAKSANQMARSKKKSYITFYNTEEEKKKIHQILLESELKKAIRNDDFEVFFQPLIHLKQNRVSTVEALARWRHPNLGLLLPCAFIGLAEEANLLTSLNELMIDKALRQAKPWLSHGIKIAVNIPVRHLLSENFIGSMNAVCHKHNVQPSSIELEITEEQALEQSLEVIEVIYGLKQYGYHVVLDDFGVGYSSLQYLSNFPVDKVKIDRSFLSSKSPKQDNIVKAILQLCQRLKIQCVCEGVENYQQLAFLSERKCDEVQGFLFSQPLHQALVEPFIKSFSLDTFFAESIQRA